MVNDPDNLDFSLSQQNISLSNNVNFTFDINISEINSGIKSGSTTSPLSPTASLTTISSIQTASTSPLLTNGTNLGLTTDASIQTSTNTPLLSSGTNLFVTSSSSKQS